MLQRKDAPGYGVGTVVIDESDLPVDGDDLSAQMRRVFLSPTYRAPSLPKAAMDLHALSRQGDTSISQIVRLLEQDVMLAGVVLKKAQTALYSRGSPIRSLHEAVVRLGLATVGNIFLEAAMSMRVFRCKEYAQPMEQLRRHSSAVAHFARMVARHTTIHDEAAFLCGLLHDAGMAACMIALTEERKPGSKIPNYDDASIAIMQVHSEAGAHLARSWQLPADVTLVLEHHHDQRVAGYPHPSVAVIALAERYAQIYGYGLESDGHDEPAWTLPALNLDSLRHLDKEAEDLAIQLKTQI